jgi:hypothetical protein
MLQFTYFAGPNTLCMTRFFLSILLLSCCNFLFAQNLTVGVSGTPLRALKAQNENGSAYFNDRFLASDVLTSAGKAISLKAIRYNLLNQGIEYLNNDVVFEVQDSIASFKITDSLGTLHLLEKKVMNNKPYFFEVLAVGKVGLLKHYTAKKSVTEDWYTKKKVTTIGNVIESFKPSKKNILALFADKGEQMKTMINSSAGDLKNDGALKALFTYYNTN